MKKRILAMVMTLAMCLSLLPVSALAVEGKENEPTTRTISVNATDEETYGVTHKTIQGAINYIEDNKTDADNWVINVAEGTYDRFLVPHGVSNVTIQGQGNDTVVTTLNGSSLAVEEDAKHNSDGQGIIIWGGNITLKNMKITSGEVTNNCWYASAVGTQDGMWGSSNEASTPITLDNCTFEGSGTGIAFMPQRSAFSMTNCRVNNYAQAIYFACDNYAANDCNVIDNIITNCVYAVHGYYGSGVAEKAMTIQENKISGVSNRFSVIAVLDQANTGAVKLDIQKNEFSYTIVGGINVREDGDMDDVMDTNTMNNYSYVADAYWYSSDDYGTIFYAPKQEGKIATWYGNPTTEASEITQEALEGALNNYGTAGQVIEINAPMQEMFTLAKNAITIKEYVDAGDLKIEKAVTNDDFNTDSFTFTVKLTRENGDVLNGRYDYVDTSGTMQTVTLKNGQFTVSMKAGDCVTIKELLPGTHYEVTENIPANYKSEATTATTGTIVAKETQIVSFKNTYVPTDVPQDSVKWEISKSKTATNLDSNYESEVTLSLPAADYKPSVDIVMVIDASSSMKDNDIAEAKAAATAMCDELARKTNVDIKIGIVSFDQTAAKVTDGLVSIENAKNAIEKIDWAYDTNMMAGLIAGKEMLDSGSGNEKYFVIMSDGVPNYWVENGNPCSKIVHQFTKVDENGLPIVTKAFATGLSPEIDKNDVSSMLSIEDILNITDWSTDSNDWYQNSDTGAIFQNGYKYTNIQKSIYMTAKYLQNNIFGQYKIKMVAFGTDKYENNAVYKYGENFCDWIGDQEQVSYFKVAKPGYGGEEGQLTDAFEEIANEIINVVDVGSYVIDEIGNGTDNKGNTYDFQFIKPETMTLTVGTEKLTAEKISDNTYGFGQKDDGTYRFVITYYPNGVSVKGHTYGECFKWDINEAITIDNRVKLNYTVKLTNPQTAAGTYGAYDEDGLDKDGVELTGDRSLYTNNNATLFPVDSNKKQGQPEEFSKPTVSYTVESSGGGGGGGGSSKPPVLNTEDHFGYIIGYPEHYLTGEACHDQTLMPVKPEGNITRAEVATIFFRMLTDESRNEFWSQTSSYADVELDDWFNNAICTLSNAGIINGYEDGTFKPNGKITRAEFATIASRFFEYADENIENPFSDVEEDTWYYQYIMAASDMGLINGYPDGTFQPDNLITRAEAVTIVNRTLDRHPDQEYFLEDMLVWPDNMDTEKWYYADMQEATNSHEYQMKTKNGEKYEVWTKMLPIRDWEAFEKAWSDANSSNNPGEVVK